MANSFNSFQEYFERLFVYSWLLFALCWLKLFLIKIWRWQHRLLKPISFYTLYIRFITIVIYIISMLRLYFYPATFKLFLSKYPRFSLLKTLIVCSSASHKDGPCRQRDRSPSSLCLFWLTWMRTDTTAPASASMRPSPSHLASQLTRSVLYIFVI